jgi:plastocyanin
VGTTTTTTTLPNQPPSADSLMPVNISTEPSVAQSFTVGYSDPNGYLNMTDASLFLSGTTHNEWVHYNPQTNRFTMMGVGGDCAPGQATTLSNLYLVLNCNSSSASGSGPNLTVVYNLTPQPPLSGAAYRLIMAVSDQGGSSSNRDMGYWVVNRRPNADSVTPMNSATQAGMEQTFVSVYSDPDGYQNIAEANFYLSGNGGTHNEWLHYISSINKFVMMGTNDICNPGQPTTISNGFLTLDCGASIVSGSGTVLTMTFRVTPEAVSSGINYNIFTGASDHAGAAHGAFGGTWQIATPVSIVLNETGFNPGNVVINVGDSVKWEHLDPTGSVHWIKSSDYEGRPCYDSTFVGGDSSSNTGSGVNTDGLLAIHRDQYIHFFPSPGGACYYRCIIIPGMEGVIHVRSG